MTIKTFTIMIKTKFIKLTALVLCALLWSCDDKINDDGASTEGTTVNLIINRPEGMAEDVTIEREHTVFYNISTGRTSEFGSGAEIRVTPGLYDIDHTAEVHSISGVTSTLRATGRSIQISGEQMTVTLQGYNTIESNDLIIAEIFFAGTLRPSGNQYYGDDYVKLYNNTDHVIYADGLTLFETKFTTTEKYDYTPNIMNEAVTVHALYTIPGSGTEHPVQPGEYMLLADTGIDHRQANSNSFDLSHADFEWYDLSTSPSSMDIDSPTVPNLDKWYCYTLSFWMLHNRGFKAYGIARIPTDRDTYLRDYLYSYDYTIHSAAGDFPMTGQAYRLPNEWVVDVVNCSVQSNYAWNLTAPSLDCGWAHCGSIDKDKTRYFHSVRRKMLYLDDQGHPVLKDTNNSTEDFNHDCIASEIEIQGTAINAEGTLCTTETYDGVTPIK